MPSQMSTRPPSTPNPSRIDLVDFVPTSAENSQSGASSTSRSGRKPLPTPKAHAPMSTKLLSPFHARHEQDAVSSENNARFGRSGPSTPEYQNTGFNKSRSAAA